MMVWRRASSRSAVAGMMSPATTRMPMPSAVKSPTSPPGIEAPLFEPERPEGQIDPPTMKYAM